MMMVVWLLLAAFSGALVARWGQREFHRTFRSQTTQIALLEQELRSYHATYRRLSARINNSVVVWVVQREDAQKDVLCSVHLHESDAMIDADNRTDELRGAERYNYGEARLLVALPALPEVITGATR